MELDDTSSIDPRLTFNTPSRRKGQQDTLTLSDHGNPEDLKDDLDTQLPSFNASELFDGELHYVNDFDIALQDATFGPPLPAPPSQTERAVPWLRLWRSQNPNRLPTEQELEHLAHFTGLPATEILSWMNTPTANADSELASEASSVPTPSTATNTNSMSLNRPFRPKCLTSSFRHRYKPSSADPSRVFECTFRCGQSFKRQGEWARHERCNIEEWRCRICSKTLPRREKLQRHLADKHSSMQSVAGQMSRVELVSPSARPCGFCGHTFTTWSAWTNHVGAYFDRRVPGGPWTAARWTERIDLNSRESAVERCESSMSMIDWDDDSDLDDGSMTSRSVGSSSAASVGVFQSRSTSRLHKPQRPSIV